MTTDFPDPDSWSEWLLRRRFGSDAGHEPVVLRKVERFRDRVLDGAGPLAGKVLIDVGAGDGLISFGAFERAGPSMQAILVDVSDALLQRAQQRAVECGISERCIFLHSTAEQLDGVADGSADVVTTRAVLAYLADKTAATRSFNRVLRPGGRISIAEPINRDEAVHLAAFANYLRTDAGANVAPLLKLLHRCQIAMLPSLPEEIEKNPLTNFSERDLLSIFQNAGFVELHLELHIDVMKQAPIAWDTYLDIAPRPDTPTLREVFAERLTDAEQRYVEKQVRPLVESGRHKTREATAYLTGFKP